MRYNDLAKHQVLGPVPQTLMEKRLGALKITVDAANQGYFPSVQEFSRLLAWRGESAINALITSEGVADHREDTVKDVDEASNRQSIAEDRSAKETIKPKAFNDRFKSHSWRETDQGRNC